MLRAIHCLLIAVAALCLGATAPNGHAGDTLQRVVDFRVLTVGMSASQPPMSMARRDGSLMGYDVDLAEALAAAMKARLDIRTMPFGAYA